MSTEVTTEMMDITIARFMGGTRIQHPEQILFSEDHFGYVCHKGHWWNENNLQYHTSWDWLIPVVEKIESIFDSFHGYFGVHISSNSCCIQGTKFDTRPGKEHYAYFNDVVDETKIKATHYAVYQFITWYNNQQKQTNGNENI